MRDDIDPALRSLAEANRKRLTDPERRLWHALRHRLAIEGTHFRRQVVIGRAIVDFACVAHRLVVEVDGEQHGFEAVRESDARRTAALEVEGWRVLRFSNAQVRREMDSVLETILAAIERRL